MVEGASGEVKPRKRWKDSEREMLKVKVVSEEDARGMTVEA